jgi:hypothetical protein
MESSKPVFSRVLLASLLAILMSSCFLMSGLQSASAARPLATGVTVPDASSDEQLGYDRIRSAGARYTRVAVVWSLVAPAKKPAKWNPTDPADPNYHWQAFDQQVTRAVRAGLTPIVQINSAPRWAERCVAKGEPGNCNPDPAAFQRFTRAAVRRYSGNFNGLPRVRYWEPWNEPNLHIFFKPQRIGKKRLSPYLYRNLLNRFAAAVKGGSSTNLVIGGGLAPLGGVGSTSPLDFTRRLLCMKGRKHPVPIRGCKGIGRFDIWAINPYTTGGPAHKAINPDDVQLGDVGEMVRLVRAARKYGKIKSAKRYVPVWITEFSWDSRPPDPHGLKMGLLSRWTSEAMFRSWRAGVDNFFWLSIRDWARQPGQPFSESIESGLWFRGGTIQKDRPKRVLKAFRFPFVAFRKKTGILVWGRTPNSKSGRVTIRFGRRYGKVNRRIKVVHTNKFGVFQGFVRTRLGRNRRGFLTARFGSTSLPFSLKPVRDFYHPPFG